MRINVYGNPELFENVKPWSRKNGFEVVLLESSTPCRDGDLSLLPSDLFMEMRQQIGPRSLVLLYQREEPLRELLPLLREGALDLIPADASCGEVGTILDHALEVSRLIREKEGADPLASLQEVAAEMVDSYSVDQTLLKSLQALKRFGGFSRLYISLIREGVESPVASLGIPLQEIREGLEKTKDQPWIRDFQEGSGIVRLTARTHNPLHRKGCFKLPHRFKEKTIGVLTVDNGVKPLPRRVSPGFLSLASLLISLYLENVRNSLESWKAKEQIRRREQDLFMERLADSLNHEINNPLAIAYLNLESLRDKMEEPRRAAKNLNNIQVSLERIKGLMENLNKLRSEKFRRRMVQVGEFDFSYEV